MARTQVTTPPGSDGSERSEAPEALETQNVALVELRRTPGVRDVRVCSMSLVSGSVQMLIEVFEQGKRPYRAVIAPSGRTYCL